MRQPKTQYWSDAPNIRFYAGYPLKAPDGHKVGTLCVIDTEPRDIADDDLNTLRQLGELIEQELTFAETVRDDPVTGLPNRAGFALVAQHLLALAVRMLDYDPIQHSDVNTFVSAAEQQMTGTAQCRVINLSAAS